MLEPYIQDMAHGMDEKEQQIKHIHKILTIIKIQ